MSNQSNNWFHHTFGSINWPLAIPPNRPFRIVGIVAELYGHQVNSLMEFIAETNSPLHSIHTCTCIVYISLEFQKTTACPESVVEGKKRREIPEPHSGLKSKPKKNNNNKKTVKLKIFRYVSLSRNHWNIQRIRNSSEQHNSNTKINGI